MGRRKLRPHVVQMPIQAWQDLVIFTALLLGAEFYRPYYYESKDGLAYGNSRFDCARKWLWHHGLNVRRDGSIYQVVGDITGHLTE